MLRCYSDRARTSFVRSVSTFTKKLIPSSSNFPVVGTLADQTYTPCKCAALINHQVLDQWLFVALQVSERGQ